MSTAEPVEARIATIAETLAGSAPVAIKRVGGGRNSRVFRLETSDGTFALKQYPSRMDDPRDRLGTEAAALRWMEDHGISTVPRLVAVDREENFALLSWAGGELVRDVGVADVDQAAAFLKRLHDLRETPAIPRGHLATEACLSGAEIERQIRARIASLGAIKGEPDLHAFLHQKIEPAFAAFLQAARAAVAAANLSFDAEIEQTRRSLVPSDFGFHNALRDADGRLTFIDFEYFGWDDPVKLTADVMLHPGTPVAPFLRRHFGEVAARLYGTDPSFVDRLEAFYPLFCLRWGLILLNEFHPERWRRRVLAGATDNWQDAKVRQLVAARNMVCGLEKEKGR